MFLILKFKIKFFIALYFRKNTKFQKNYNMSFEKKTWKKELNFFWLQKKFITKISQNYHIFIFFLFFLFHYLNNRSDISKKIFPQWSILRFYWFIFVRYVFIQPMNWINQWFGTRRWVKVSGSCMCLNKRKKKKKKKGSCYKKFFRKRKSII